MARRAIREYVAAVEGENAPTNPDRKPKSISPSGPAAAWTIRGRNKVMFGYSLNYLIDMENAVILDVEATPTRISKEVIATEIMIERTEDRFSLKPDHIAGDVAYGTGKMLGWLREKRLSRTFPLPGRACLHVREGVWDKANRKDDTFSRSDFTFDKDADIYTCPAGKILSTTGHRHNDKTLLYRARKLDCQHCTLKQRCCPKVQERKIPRDINEDARDYTRSLMGSEAYLHSAQNRKKIERLFGEAKRNLAMTRLRLRGITGANDEFLLTATVQNLKRLAKLVSRPPPKPMIA